MGGAAQRMAENAIAKKQVKGHLLIGTAFFDAAF
jgi:hypothetical protein